MIYTVLFLQGGFVETLSGIWPLLLMFGVVYFFFIKPQNKKAKDQASFIKNLGKGDEVVTNGGIYGKITKIDDTKVTLQVDQKSYITFQRSAINHEMTLAIGGEENK